MLQSTLFAPHFSPLVVWDSVENTAADAALETWGHWLGGCNRPFGRQSWGLWFEGSLVAVAVSASTVNKRCAGYDRKEIVELARLCAHPDHRDLTRVALRLWRKTAAAAWAFAYWPVKAYVSYANATRHRGDIYRFDGWRRMAEVAGSGGGGGWQPKRVREPKTVWVYVLDGRSDEKRREP